MGKILTLEDEFLHLYRFLSREAPNYFVQSVGLGDFSVNPSIDDDPIASFLLNFDQFSELLPLAIQRYLRGLNFDWIVVASFNIKDPISEHGVITKSPNFIVKKNSISGFVNVDQLKKIWGNRLVSAINQKLN
jgi:hypothetical protein